MQLHTEIDDACHRTAPRGHRRGGLAGVSFALIALALLAFAVGATAQSTSGVVPPPGRLGSLPPAPAPPAGTSEPAIAYYVSHFAVSKTEARRRLEIQNRDPRLQDELRDGLGKGFVQLWFDNTAGGLVIAIAPGADAAQADRLLGDLGFAKSEYALKREPFTAAQLAQALADTSSALKAEITGGQASVAIGAGVIHVYLDKDLPVAERQSIGERSTAAASRSTVEVVRRDIQRSAVSPPPAQCARPYCDPVVAGVEWDPAGCSLAFYVGAPPGQGYFFLTAGHCITGPPSPPGSSWYTCTPGGGNCGVGGQVIGGYYDGGDAAVVRVDSFGFGLFPGWVNWWSNTITRATASADPVVNYVLCHNGHVAGSSCGTVSDTNWGFNQTTARDMGGSSP